MARTTTARVAGITFLLYIAAGLSGLAGLSGGAGVAALLTLVQCFCALVLAVTLYGLTHDLGPDIGMLGLVCRTAEGILGAASIPLGAARASVDPEAAKIIDTILRGAGRSNMVLCATFFAVGSLAFCWLFLRGRLIPVALAWLGVFASVLLVACLPLQLAGFLRGTMTMVIWLPMLVFEVPLGVWLIVKGVAAPPRPTSA